METNNRQLYKLLSCGCEQQVELDFSPTIAYLGIEYHLSTSVLSRKLSGSILLHLFSLDTRQCFFLRPFEDTITSTSPTYLPIRPLELSLPTHLTSLLVNTIASRCDKLCTSVVYHLSLNVVSPSPTASYRYCTSV